MGRANTDKELAKILDHEDRIRILEGRKFPRPDRNAGPVAGGGITDWAFASDNSIRSYSSGSPRKHVILADAWETAGSAISIGGANGNVFTINAGGLYLCAAQCEFNSNGAAGRRTLTLEHSSGLPTGLDLLDDDNEASTSISTDLQFGLPVPLVAGDTMTLKLMQTSGSSVQLLSAWAGIVQLAAS